MSQEPPTPIGATADEPSSTASRSVPSSLAAQAAATMRAEPADAAESAAPVGQTAAVDRGLASDADAAAVRRVLAGDRDAYAELVERHQRKAISVSFRLVGQMHDAVDIVQDALLKAYRSLDTLQDPRLFGPWLLRIVSNYSLNHRRHRKVASVVAGESTLPAESGGLGGLAITSPAAEASASMRGRDLADRLARAMEQLPDRQRLALVLFSVENMPQKQVADVIGCSIEAVKWYVFQARKQLRELLADDIEA